MYERIDRELSEAVWQEELELMSEAEIAEMVRRQEFERGQDYFSQWPTIDDLDEVGINFK